MSTDFENIPGRRLEYDPQKRNVKIDHKDDAGTNTPYYGPILGKTVIDEITAWTELITALKDGLPKPYDNSIIVDKIIRIEDRYSVDLTDLKNCCPPSAEVREAKEFKPLIFGILDRIIEIGEIKKYVDRYN